MCRLGTVARWLRDGDYFSASKLINLPAQLVFTDQLTPACILFPVVSQLFYAIVTLFRLVCRFTGLSYAELNILVYCALVPMGWLLLVVWRRKSLWPWLLGQVGVLLAVLIVRRGHMGTSGQRFYDYNIAVLEKLGHATGGGYLAVALLMGVFIPAVSMVLLLSVPRRALVGMYLFFIAALVTYFWMGQAEVSSSAAF